MDRQHSKRAPAEASAPSSVGLVRVDVAIAVAGTALGLVTPRDATAADMGATAAMLNLLSRGRSRSVRVFFGLNSMSWMSCANTEPLAKLITNAAKATALFLGINLVMGLLLV
jgi:hypothetical protein